VFVFVCECECVFGLILLVMVVGSVGSVPKLLTTCERKDHPLFSRSPYSLWTIFFYLIIILYACP
jgi:hypothetical protein